MKKVFIANRGEIARRIAITSKKMGIQTVCIKNSEIPPTYLTDVVTEFIFVPNESTSHYLDQNFMIELAKSTNCDAVHPGFGFLSENANFARACQKAEMIWIGPNPKSIDAMASKAAARQIAEASNVPIVPGLNGLKIDTEDGQKMLAEFANKFGFPILLKAAFGGGGKGMRIVREISELLPLAQRAASEAKNSFGDSLLIAERYLERSRHVEVQVLADHHGQIKIFGDRDCSLQRRHQKILEEAPATNLPSAMREKLHRSAEQLARAVKYDNAGTVEFIVEVDAQGDPLEYYFLEMNTRLQVEHCVTEEIFGVDLVAQQIHIARDERLTPEIMQMTPRGHSVEVRIYAENVRENFLPAPGPVLAFKPMFGPGVRWEIGVDAVDEITANFDPMISKLVVTAQTREEAFSKLHNTLKSTVFMGTESNFLFLQWLSQNPRVLLKPTDTNFIGENLSEFKKFENIENLESENYKKLFDAAEERLTGVGLPAKATESTDSFTLNAFSSIQNLTRKITHQNFLLHSENRVFYRGSGVESGAFFVPSLNQNIWFVKGHVNHQKALWFWHQGVAFKAPGKAQDLNAIDGNLAGEKSVLAPVPGRIVAVSVRMSDHVRVGQQLFVLESMKMEFEIKSTIDGTVKSINTELGMIVTGGALLLEWET